MPIFHAHISFNGLKPRHVERLGELMHELPCGGGIITRASDSPGVDFPTGISYHFSNDDYETSSEFRRWLQELIEAKIHHPVELTTERMDGPTGLAVPE